MQNHDGDDRNIRRNDGGNGQEISLAVEVLEERMAPSLRKGISGPIWDRPQLHDDMIP